MAVDGLDGLDQPIPNTPKTIAEPTGLKESWQMTQDEYSKGRNLGITPELPEKGVSPTVKTDDGQIFVDVNKPAETPHEQEFLDKAKQNNWDIDRIESDLQKQYDSAINEHIEALKLTGPNAREIAIDHLRNGYIDPTTGKVPPVEKFIQMEGALNGLKGLQAKLRTGSSEASAPSADSAATGAGRSGADLREGEEGMRGQPTLGKGSEREAPAPTTERVDAGAGRNGPVFHEGAEGMGGQTIQDGLTNQPITEVSRGSSKFTDPNVEKSWQAAAKGAGRSSLINNVLDGLSKIWAKPERAYALLPHTGEFAPLRRGLLQLDNKASFAKKTAGILEDLTKGLDDQGLDLYTRKVIFDNLAHDTGDLPFGITKEAFAKEKAALDNAVANNPQVAEALNQRSEVRNSIKNEYSKAMGDIGVDLTERIKDPGYFEQQASLYAKAKALAGKDLSGRNVIADHFKAEHEVMAQMLHDTEMAKTIKIARDNYDIKSSLQDKFGDKWRENIPEGYTTWQPRDGSSFYLAESIQNKLAAEYFKRSLEELGLKPEEINRFMAKGSPLEDMVIKREVADALNKQGTPPTEGIFDKITRTAVSTGKMVTDPLGIKSIISNTFGDIGKLISFNPSACGKIKQAARELYNAFYGDHTLTDSLQGWFDRGGMDSFTNVEGLGKAGSGEGLSLPAKVRDIYKNTVTKAADFRDSILAYANYLDYLEQMKKNGGKPENFGVSKSGDVMAIADLGDRAYKLSSDIRGNELLSEGGKYASEHFAPWLKDVEIGAKQYLQFIKNGATDEKLAQAAGRAVLGKAVRSLDPVTISDLISKSRGAWDLLQAYSNLTGPEKKEKAAEMAKDLPSSAAKYALNSALQTISPVYTLPIELATGKQYFSSDIFNPKEIKDRPQYMADKLHAGRVFNPLSRSDIGRWLGMDPRP
jgi:hypothetical protein